MCPVAAVQAIGQGSRRPNPCINSSMVGGYVVVRLFFGGGGRVTPGLGVASGLHCKNFNSEAFSLITIAAERRLLCQNIFNDHLRR